MAELLGAIASGVTLAALFKACVEAFDLIQTSRQQEADFKKLKLRLNIEKCRLYIWGESMGLTDTAEADKDRPIDRFRFPEVVREILEVVFQLFHDSHKIRDKYGCRQATSEDLLLDADQNGPISSLAASFSNFSIRSSLLPRTSRMMQNIIWVIHDRKKFGALVTEVKDLVDSLQGITSPSVPVARQAGTMRRKIVNIRDAETLSLIAEVCSEDHPDIADAASTKADTMSLASTHQRYVVAWTESVQEVQVEAKERMSPDLESLTVTELKHKLLEMIQERKERETSSLSAPEPLAVFPSVEFSVASPSAFDSATKDSNIIPSSAVLQTTEQVSLLETQTGRASIHESMDYRHSFHQSYFTNPWAKTTSLAGVYPPPVQSSSDVIAAQQPALSTYVDSLSYAKSHQYPDPTFSQLGASQGIPAVSQQSFNDMTPRNIYGALTQRAQTDNYGFPTTSSVSSNSASSNYGYPYYAGSASGSVDDPTDGSSVTSDAGYQFGGVRSSTFAAHGRRNCAKVYDEAVSVQHIPLTMKKHNCDFCHKGFSRPSSLQTHMYSHTNEKPFACKVEGCGRSFSVMSNLRRHRKGHVRGEREELG